MTDILAVSGISACRHVTMKSSLPSAHNCADLSRVHTLFHTQQPEIIQ